METQLLKDKPKKTIERIVKILKKKSSTIYKKLQSLVGLFSFTAKTVCSGQIFLQRFYDALTKGGKYLHQSKLIKDNLF